MPRAIAARLRVHHSATLRTVRATGVLVALALSASPVLADDDPPKASPRAQTSEEAASHTCGNPEDHHPHDCEHVPQGKQLGDLRSPESRSASGNSDLASKLANPSAPILQLATFMDVTQHGGSLPGAHRASYTLSAQPALPFQTHRGNLILRPLISFDFGQPYVTSSGNVETAVQFGNIALDSVFGKTFKNGLLLMGGVNTVFPTGSKPELRADWTFGPEIVVGYASKKTGNVWGAILGYSWSSRPTCRRWAVNTSTRST